MPASDRSLREYKRKRDLKSTPEPLAKREKRRGDIFVVHKHHARRLHWDLRLEVEGALASWAVPKEPTVDPTVKRLAVHVEDHPLEYAKFKGEIPKGQYGAGLVEIWDKGTWTPEGDAAKQIKKGELKFSLHGKKLKGRFLLVRMGKDDKNWLLIKKDDDEAQSFTPPDAAKKSEVPRTIKLQLCKPSTSPPRGTGWVHEVKWDGYRALVYVRDGEVRIESRGGKTLHVPHLEAALDSLPDCVLDGEIVAIKPDGVTSFRLVHEAMASGKTAGLVFYAFDSPFAEGFDLRGAPLVQRKEACRRLVVRAGVDTVRFSEHSDASGDALFANACKSGLEGIVSKRADSRYGAGRTGAWVKCRCLSRLKGVVIGYTPHSRSKHAVGALVVAERGIDGELLFAGRVGTGFSESLRAELFTALQSLHVSARPVSDVPKDADVKGVRWVEPEIPVEVEFLEWSAGGVMRQPSLVSADISTRKKDNTDMRGIKVTSPERVIDKVSGATKAEVVAYFARAAERMLPYAGGRPLAIVRCPDGLKSTCFFQKHGMKGLHDSVGRVSIGDDPEDQNYMDVSSATGIAALAQFGMLELHVWGSKSNDLERPDTVVFDLDPGPDVSWKAVVDGSLELRRMLDRVGLSSWARVTGGKGVHVLVPIKPELSWDVVKSFTQEVARAMEKESPKKYISVMSKSKRGGRIFIDYLRNGRGSTAVTSYSLRARPGLPVAVPVSWDELSTLSGPAAFTIKNIEERLEAQDPWKGFARSRRSLKRLL